MGKIARLHNDGRLAIKGELIEKEVIPPTLYFNGVSQAVTIPNTNNRFQPTPQTTWELWFKIDLTNHAQHDCLMGFANNNWDIRMDGAQNFTGHWYSASGAWSSTIQLSSAYSLWDEQWHHIAIVWDGVNGKKYGYVDGVQRLNGSFTPENPRDLTPYNFANFTVGGCNNGNSRRMNGNIKEVRIWNTARTEEEIVSNMNNKLTGDEEGLTFYLPLNEGKGETVIDKASGFEASINGAEWIADDSIVRFNDGGDLIVNGTLEEISPIQTTYLESADFEQDFNGWQEHHTGAGIIERIEENGSIVVYGHGDGGGRWGIQKDFLLQNSPQTIVKFDYRIKTGLAHAGVTNLFFELRAYGDDGIYSSFINSNINTEAIADTGWRTFEMDITSLVQGKSGMRMRLYQNDVWSADHKQSFYVDNIEIIQISTENRLFSIDKPNNKVILYGKLIENVNFNSI